VSKHIGDDRTVRLSEEYYRYLVHIAGQRKRSLKAQLEQMVLEWIDIHDWEMP
jgi:predicted transcriptional regulator